MKFKPLQGEPISFNGCVAAAHQSVAKARATRRFARIQACAGLALGAHRRGEAFAVLAAEPPPGLLHIHPLLFAAGRSADGRDQIQIKTFGAAHFIDREIHLLPNPPPLAEALNMIMAFVRLATADQGYIIPDGHSFGPDDGSVCYRVRHVPQRARSGGLDGPVYQLELLHAREHGYTAPDDIAPTRSFDDRNIQADVIDVLGEKREAMVNEWRNGTPGRVPSFGKRTQPPGTR